MTAEPLWVCELGTVEYREALALQERVRSARQAEAVPDTLLLLEHPAVYTRGRRSLPGELPLGEDWYRERGIDIVDVDRGGKLTYHGPGQLVGYPIMRIVDVIDFLRTIEHAIVATLAGVAALDARARPDDGPDYTGVWAGTRKIASIGVHVSRGVTTHGFAINVDNDLEPFSWVVPCGLPSVRMTSVLAEAVAGGSAPDPAAIRRSIAAQIAAAFTRRVVALSHDRLEAALGAAGDGSYTAGTATRAIPAADGGRISQPSSRSPSR